MIGFFKRLFCRHYRVEFIRNVYGDEINERNCRSLWRCSACGYVLQHPTLLNTGEQNVIER